MFHVKQSRHPSPVRNAGDWRRKDGPKEGGRPQTDLKPMFHVKQSFHPTPAREAGDWRRKERPKEGTAAQ
jgi:hypothetical protein